MKFKIQCCQSNSEHLLRFSIFLLKEKFILIRDHEVGPDDLKTSQHTITKSAKKLRERESSEFWCVIEEFVQSGFDPKMPRGTLEVLLVSAKGLDNTDFLCKSLSLSLSLVSEFYHVSIVCMFS